MAGQQPPSFGFGFASGSGSGSGFGQGRPAQSSSSSSTPAFHSAGSGMNPPPTFGGFNQSSTFTSTPSQTFGTFGGGNSASQNSWPAQTAPPPSSSSSSSKNPLSGSAFGAAGGGNAPSPFFPAPSSSSPFSSGPSANSNATSQTQRPLPNQGAFGQSFPSSSSSTFPSSSFGGGPSFSQQAGNLSWDAAGSSSNNQSWTASNASGGAGSSSANQTWTPANLPGPTGSFRGGGRGGGSIGAASSRGKPPAFGNKSVTFNNSGQSNGPGDPGSGNSISDSADNANSISTAPSSNPASSRPTAAPFGNNEASASAVAATPSTSFGGSQAKSFAPPQSQPPAQPPSSQSFLSAPSSSTQPFGSPAPNTSSSRAPSPARDEDEERRQRFSAVPKNNRFLELKAERPALRQRYIDQGVLPDPDKPQALSQASKFKGTCMEMCPEFEREEREFQGEGDELEVFPGTTKLDPAVAVKIYRRPAAGRELPLPEDVRPPPVLKKTLDHLIHRVVPADPEDERLANVQGFIWNRTRAIRQDFIVQAEAGPIVIECHERIARWHILSLHWRGGSVDARGQPKDISHLDRDPWSEQQELEQLAKTLTSLNEFYDDLRQSTGQDLPSPNEAEFRAYHLILNIYDPEVLRSVELLPEDIFDAPILQAAIRLRGYAQRANRGGSNRANALNTDAPMNFFSRFFSEARSSKVNYLLACMAENKFADVREGALKALCANYNKAHRGPSVAFIREALAADSVEEVLRWAEIKGIEVQYEGGEASLKLNKQVEMTTKALPQPFSVDLVEAKRGGQTSQQIVDGESSTGTASLQSGGLAPAPAPAPAAAPKQPWVSSSPATTAPVQSFKAAPAPVENATASLVSKGTSAFGFESDAANSSVSAFGSPQATAFTTPVEGKAVPAPAAQPAKMSPFAPSFQPSSTIPSGQGQSFSSLNLSKTLRQSATPVASAQTPPAFSQSERKATLDAPVKETQFQLEDKPSKVSPFAKTDASSAFSFGAETNKPAQGSTRRVDETAVPVSKEITQKSAPAPVPAAPSLVTPSPQQTEARDRKALTVLKHLVNAKAQEIASNALMSESHRRRAQRRGQFISKTSTALQRHLLREAVESRSFDIAAVALSDEAYRRRLLGGKLLKWQVELMRRQEKERQRVRLEEIREQVAKRGLLDRSFSRDMAGKSSFRSSQGGLRGVLLKNGAAHSSVGSSDSSIEGPAQRARWRSSASNEDEDDLLRSSFSTMEIQRAHLWQEGSFLVSIAARVAEITQRWRPTTSLGQWTVFVDLPSQEQEDSEAAMVWLKHKFGFVDDRQDKVIPVAPELAVVGRMWSVHGDAEDAGMCIFVLSPTAAHGGAAGDDIQWTAEAGRLRRLTASKAVAQSKFAPRLLVLDLRSSQASRASTLSRLGVDLKTSPWLDVAVLNLAGEDGEPDDVFARGVQGFVRDVALTSKSRGARPDARERLTQLAAPLRTPWSAALVALEASFGSLTVDVQQQQQFIKGIVEAIVNLLAVANYALRVVADGLSTLSELARERTQLPRPSVEVLLEEIGPDSQVRDAFRGVAALLLAQLSRSDGEVQGTTLQEKAAFEAAQASVGAASSLLFGSGQGQFSFSTFLEHLFQSRLVVLQVSAEQLDAVDSQPQINATAMAEASGQVKEWCVLVLSDLNDGIRIARQQHAATAAASKSVPASNTTPSAAGLVSGPYGIGIKRSLPESPPYRPSPTQDPVQQLQLQSKQPFIASPLRPKGGRVVASLPTRTFGETHLSSPAAPISASVTGNETLNRLRLAMRKAEGLFGAGSAGDDSGAVGMEV